MMKILKCSRGSSSMLEIILVIVIAATLAMMAVPNLNSAMDNKRLKNARMALVDIADAIRSYERDYATVLTVPSSSDSNPNFLTQMNDKQLIRFVSPTNHDFEKRFTYSIVAGGGTEKYRLTATYDPDTTKKATYAMNKDTRELDAFD